MATITPVWTDNVSVIATDLARGSTTRGTVDARGKWGVRFTVRIGRTTTTALTNGVDLLIRPAINNDSIQHPGSTVRILSETVAGSETTCATSDSNSGQAALNVANITGFAVGDLILITGGSGTREEWHRVSKTATGVLTLDANLKSTHTTAQADTVNNKATCPAPIELPGGTVWEVVADYGDDSGGDSVRIDVRAQTLDSVSST